MSQTAPRTVLAIDPGVGKCGVAIVQEDGTTLHRAVVPTQDLLPTLQSLEAQFHPIALVLGNGTGSKPIRHEITQSSLSAPLHLVSETNTTQVAKERYFMENRARGLQRLLPRSLRTPPVPVDDYVASLLGERYWLEHLP